MTLPRALGGGLAAVLALALVAGGLVLAAGPATGVPRAWFDRPTAGTLLPDASILVIIHATDASGVDAIDFSVDRGWAERYLPAEPGRLVSVQFRWTPESPGPHVLRAWGVNRNGSMGLPAEVLVIVGELPVAESPGPSVLPSPDATGSPGPSPEATGGATPAPTASPRPTPAPTPPPCTPPAPNLLEPFDGEEIRDPGLNPPTFRWAYRGDPPACTPSGFRIEVDDDRSFGSPRYSVNLGPNAGSWTPPAALPDCTTFFWRVVPLKSNGGDGTPTDPWSVVIFIRCA